MTRWCLSLLASSVALALDPDQSILRLLPKPGESRILNRTPVNSELDVVVTLGDPSGWWNPKSPLGVFLQRRGQPGLIYQIALANGIYDSDCFVRVERATETDVVIACHPEKGGPGPHRKFVYDVRAKGLVKRVDYSSSPVERRVTLQYQPRQEPPFRLLAGRVESPQAKQPQLRQSTYDEFALARPTQAANGYTRKVATMNEEIGPMQVVAGTRWFGKTFYDAEGVTGVGGFGYFDPATKAPVLYSPKEIRDRSVTGMLVEPDAVWLGIAHRGEWGTSGGGILRFDRATQQVTQVPLREIVHKIVRSGDALVLDTDFGAAIFDGSNIRRFFVDETTDGRLRVAEAIPSRLGVPDLQAAQR